MASPPKYPLMDFEPPFCCKVRVEDELVYEQEGATLESVLYNTAAKDTRDQYTHNSKKRNAEEPEPVDLELKRRIAHKQQHTFDNTVDSLVNTSTAKDTENDHTMLETPEEEEDNNLANQLLLREPVPQQAPAQGAVPHAEATTELPLPSPSASPKQSSALDDMQTVADILPKSTAIVLDSLENYANGSLPAAALNNLVFRLMRRTDRSALSDILNSIGGALKRDMVSCLPVEISQQIILNLDHKSLKNALLVSKRWNKLITQDTWKHMLLKDEFLTVEELEDLRPKAEKDTNFYRKLYTRRRQLFQNWVDPNFEPRKITVPGHGANVVTCLQFDDEKIITGADDKMINIYNPENGDLVRVLQGHEGGVWALKYIGNQIVSGSTDRTVRVWNIKTGKCTHVLRGHTSTIRCMEIVTTEAGERYIVTGSRDNTLHVWRLPDEDDDGSDYDSNVEPNPYFVTVLRGHTASVRAVTGHGNIIVSGSYDHTVRVWDLVEKKTLFVLEGHTDRIYSTILDVKRHRCISASMDSTIRVWDLKTGACLAELTKHTSLVGLLGLSARYLVSAAADGTLRGWDPENYDNKFVLHQDNHAAITTFHATPNFLVSGSEGQFNVYDLRHNGKLIRSNLLPDAGPIWSAKFNESKCVVAVEKNTHSFIEILDFSKRA